MTIDLDCSKMNIRENAHEYLADKFDFADYYGKNLDALYDSLTDICEHTMIKINVCNMVRDKCDEYLEKIIETIKDAAEENEYLELEVF